MAKSKTTLTKLEYVHIGSSSSIDEVIDVIFKELNIVNLI